MKRLKTNKLITRTIKEKMKSLISKDREDVYMIWSASKIVVEKEWVFPLRYQNFENVKVKLFCLPEKYLIKHYGNDFLKLPPDEKRRISINRIDIN